MSPRPAHRRSRSSGRRALAIACGLALLSAACAGQRTDSKEFFQLTPESAANKAMQTRLFETSDRTELLSASAAALQDLGFQITETDRAVGFLRAAKERSAREWGQEITRPIVGFLTLALGALGGANTMYLAPVDLHQQINASLVARTVGGPGSEGEVRSEVRILFYRLVWKGDGQSGDTYIPPGEQKMEMLRDPLLYQRFFARLSKSVFLEAEKI